MLPELYADLFRRHACPSEEAVFFVVVVQQTCEKTYSSTSYEVPGILPETGWEVFTIRAEEGRS